MGSLHPNPLVLRFADQLAGFVGEGAVFALHHIPDVDLAADHVFHRLVGPFVVDAAGVALALALVVQHAGGGYPFLIERRRDRMKSHAGGPHRKDTAHNGRGFLVDHKVVLIQRVAPVTVGGIGSHELAALGAGFLDGLDLLAGIPAIKFVK